MRGIRRLLGRNGTPRCRLKEDQAMTMTIRHSRRSLAVLTGAAALIAFLGAAAPAQELVSNVDGKIRVVILHNAFWASFWADGFWFDQTVLFRDLLAKMDREVGFVVLLGKDENAARTREALEPYADTKLPDGTDRVKFLVVDVKSSQFYPWARDPYFIQTDPSGGLVFLDAGYNEKPFPITSFSDVFAGARTLAGTVQRGGGNVRTTDQDI